jgi:hypothetical protein
MRNKLFRKTDLIIILTVALAALIFILWQRSGKTPLTADISVNGKTVESVNLSKVTDRVEIRPEGTGDVLIVAENGRIRFEFSDCPDKLCVKQGELYRKGDTAVCLPEKTVITVRGSELDAVTY